MSICMCVCVCVHSSQHRLQILRDAESIVNPQEPWPYTELIIGDIPDLRPITDGLGVEGEGGDGTSEKMFESDDLDIEDTKPVVEAGGQEKGATVTERARTAGSFKRKKSSGSGSGGSLTGRVKARQEREAAASAASQGSSDHSRATTPASKEPTSPDSGPPGSNSSSPSARRQGAAARDQNKEPSTPRPPSPLQGPGKFRMLRCV
jgi:hypothetical protein